MAEWTGVTLRDSAGACNCKKSLRDRARRRGSRNTQRRALHPSQVGHVEPRIFWPPVRGGIDKGADQTQA